MSDVGSRKLQPTLSLTVSDDAPDDVRTSVPGEYEFLTPCSITGIGAGVSSAMLGYVFGFGGYWVSQRTSGVLKLANASGLHSARTFAVLGGLYAGVSCFMQRLRQKSDAVNAGVSGCSTGLVLGWGTGGWIGGLQSCVLFGAFSYFLDGTSLGGSAEAAEGGRCRRRVGVMGTTGKERGRRGREGGLGTATTATATATVATAASGGSERIRSVLLPALPLMRGDYFR